MSADQIKVLRAAEARIEAAIRDIRAAIRDAYASGRFEFSRGYRLYNSLRDCAEDVEDATRHEGVALGEDEPE